MKPEIKRIAKEKAEEFGIEPALVLAFVMVESSGNPLATRYEANFYKRYIAPMLHENAISLEEATGRATSYGLIQIMGQVAREKGFKESFETLLIPEVGLHWGLKHLKRFIKKYPDNLDDAIASYNAGSPRKKADGNYVNQGYVNKIHRAWKQMKEAS
jgi:soluble lytic murein transglycosylase-like protein